MIFEINPGIPEGSVVRTQKELEKLKIEVSIVREDTYRLLCIKLRRHVTIDEVIYISQLTINTLLL